MAIIIEQFSTSETRRILYAKRGPTPLVQVKGTNFQGSITPYVNTGPPNGAVSLQAITWRPRGTPVDSAAGQNISADGAYELNTQGLETWVTILWVAGSVTLTTLPEYVRPPDPPIIPLGNVNMDTIPFWYQEDLAFLLEITNNNKGTPSLTATPTTI